jgi:urea carboxylase
MSRYSFGGDEHLVVEISESMSLQAFFSGLSFCNAIRESNLSGISEICPANASFQLRFDPDVISPDDLLREIQSIERSVDAAEQVLSTRVIEIPVHYNDPWTREVMERFRDRRQDPDVSDLEYSARINNFAAVDAFIGSHTGAPWLVSMVGFGAGSPFMFQMVEPARQVQVPKYVRPRTDTPKQCVAQGGCFTGVYPVRGAGGYQMFGVTPTPIFDPSQTISYLKDFMILFRPGDIVKFRSIDRAEYDAISEAVTGEDFALKTQSVSFSLAEFEQAPAAYGKSIMEAVDGH